MKSVVNLNHIKHVNNMKKKYFYTLMKMVNGMACHAIFTKKITPKPYYINGDYLIGNNLNISNGKN